MSAVSRQPTLSCPSPTRLDKIKNLHLEARSGPIVSPLPRRLRQSPPYLDVVECAGNRRYSTPSPTSGSCVVWDSRAVLPSSDVNEAMISLPYYHSKSDALDPRQVSRWYSVSMVVSKPSGLSELSVIGMA